MLRREYGLFNVNLTPVKTTKCDSVTLRSVIMRNLVKLFYDAAINLSKKHINKDQDQMQLSHCMKRNVSLTDFLLFKINPHQLLEG